MNPKSPFLLLTALVFTACASITLPPAPAHAYTDAEARVRTTAASTITREQTAPQILTTLHLDPRRLFEHTSSGLNMSRWETYSLSPHYELWLAGGTFHPGQYNRAFITPRNPTHRLFPPR